MPGVTSLAAFLILLPQKKSKGGKDIPQLPFYKNLRKLFNLVLIAVGIAIETTALVAVFAYHALSIQNSATGTFFAFAGMTVGALMIVEGLFLPVFADEDDD